VLPELEAARPGAARRIAALADRAAAAESAWRELVRHAVDDVVTRTGEGVFELARDRLLGYHPHVRARVLRHLLHELGCRAGRAGTRVAMEFISSGASGGSVEFAGNVRMGREFGTIRLGVADGAQATEPAEPVRIDGPGPGGASFTVGGHRYEVRWTSEQVESQHEVCRCDLSSLRFPLQLRGAQPGDRMRLPYGSKKLKKLFQERRVARGRRARVPVLCDADGTLLWAVGVARSALAAPVPGQPVFTIMVGNGEPV
jgi:tRNA(Ile)-lysidine synthase